MTDYPALDEVRLSGEEPFSVGRESCGFAVIDFWQWAVSNLAANNLRGHLAEFLVSTALGLSGRVRSEWDSCDIRTSAGLRIEVKSASYIQQWRQTRPSRISFGIAPARDWDEEKQKHSDSVQRNSDLYVFCLIKTTDQLTFDPTDLDQWLFYVVKTAEIDLNLPNQKTVSLSRLRSLSHIECTFSELKSAIYRLSAE